MKRIASSLFAVCVVVLIASCSQYTAIDRKTMLDNAKASEEIASLRATLDQYEEDLQALSRGTSLLLSVNRESDRFKKLTDFLATINADQLRCEIRELEHYPSFLYIYRTSYYLPDGSYRPPFERKSALVLVDAKTRNVIDFTFESGYRSDGISSQEPHYEGSWDREDGTSVRYKILPSGLETSKSQEQGQCMNHTANNGLQTEPRAVRL